MHAQKHRTNYRKHWIKIIIRSLSRQIWKWVYQYNNSCDKRFYKRCMHTYIPRENQNSLESIVKFVPCCYPATVFGNFVRNKIANFWWNCWWLLTSEIRLFHWIRIMNFYRTCKDFRVSLGDSIARTSDSWVYLKQIKDWFGRVYERDIRKL